MAMCAFNGSHARKAMDEETHTKTKSITIYNYIYLGEIAWAFEEKRLVLTGMLTRDGKGQSELLVPECSKEG